MVKSSDRVPPHNAEAEVAVLGAIILKPEAILAALPVLKHEHFYRADHQTVYRAMQKLHDEKTPTDVVTLKKALRELGADDVAGNDDLFMALGGAVPSVANTEYYAKIVRDQWVLRSIITSCNETLIAAYDQKEPPGDLLGSAQKRFLAMSKDTEDSEPKNILTIISEVVDDASEQVIKKPAISTGYSAIDKLMGGGFRRGEFVIIGGRPSSGKSTWARDLFRNFTTSSSDIGCLFFSLEDTRHDFAQCLLACTANVNTQIFRDGKASKEEWQAIAKACEKLNVADCAIDDATYISPAVLSAKSQWYALEHKLDVIFVDYLQLMVGDSRSARNWTRLNEVSEISRSLKLLAKDLDVCVVALSQLNRAAVQDSSPPRISQLRECGSLEQDADVIFLIHDRSDDVVEGETDRLDLILAKQRHGPTRTIPMVFDRKTLNIRSQAPTYAAQDNTEGELPF